MILIFTFIPPTGELLQDTKIRGDFTEPKNVFDEKR